MQVFQEFSITTTSDNQVGTIDIPDIRMTVRNG